MTFLENYEKRWFIVFEDEVSQKKISVFFEEKEGQVKIECPFCGFIVEDVLKKSPLLGVIFDNDFKKRCKHYRGYFICFLTDEEFNKMKGGV